MATRPDIAGYRDRVEGIASALRTTRAARLSAIQSLNVQLSELDKQLAQYKADNTERLLRERVNRVQELQKMNDEYYTKFGSALNQKTIDFLEKHSFINAPTLTAIMAGYEGAKLSAAERSSQAIKESMELMKQFNELDTLRVENENLRAAAEQIQERSEILSSIEKEKAIIDADVAYYSALSGIEPDVLRFETDMYKEEKADERAEAKGKADLSIQEMFSRYMRENAGQTTRSQSQTQVAGEVPGQVATATPQTKTPIPANFEDAVKETASPEEIARQRKLYEEQAKQAGNPRGMLSPEVGSFLNEYNSVLKSHGLDPITQGELVKRITDKRASQIPEQFGILNPMGSSTMTVVPAIPSEVNLKDAKSVLLNPAVEAEYQRVRKGLAEDETLKGYKINFDRDKFVESFDGDMFDAGREDIVDSAKTVLEHLDTRTAQPAQPAPVEPASAQPEPVTTEPAPVETGGIDPNTAEVSEEENVGAIDISNVQPTHGQVDIGQAQPQPEIIPVTLTHTDEELDVDLLDKHRIASMIGEKVGTDPALARDALLSYTQVVQQAESKGDPLAKNPDPKSTAKSLYQFTDPSWRETIKFAQTLTDKGTIDLTNLIDRIKDKDIMEVDADDQAAMALLHMYQTPGSDPLIAEAIRSYNPDDLDSAYDANEKLYLRTHYKGSPENTYYDATRNLFDRTWRERDEWGMEIYNTAWKKPRGTRV